MKTKLRVWWIVNPPTQPEYYPIASVEEAKDKLEELTKRDLQRSTVFCNVGGLEEHHDGEWMEYYDEEGRNIDELSEHGFGRGEGCDDRYYLIYKGRVMTPALTDALTEGMDVGQLRVWLEKVLDQIPTIEAEERCQVTDE